MSKYIEMFFRDPQDKPTFPGEFSTLYLLRRDIETCLGRDPTTRQQINFQALWPAAISIFAGIDLLAKFCSGDKGGVGERFKEFINKYSGLDKDKADVLYILRNSLVHSFGLYSEHESKNKKIIHTFTLNNNTGELSIKTNETKYTEDVNGVSINVEANHFIVSIKELNYLFNKLVNSYHEDLKKRSDLPLFNAMFKKYGGPITIR